MMFLLSLLSLLPSSYAQVPAAPIPSAPNPASTETVESKPAAPAQMAVIKVTSPAQVPSGVSKILGFKDADLQSISEEYPWYFSFSLLNDNSIFNPKGANDYALTARTSVTVGKRTSDGYEFGVYGYTAAYTERMYHYRNPTTGQDYFVPFVGYKNTKGPVGSKLVGVTNEQDQEFNEDNIVSLFANNIGQNKWYLWETNVGFAMESSSNFGTPDELSFQASYHKALRIWHELNVPDGRDNEYSLYLKQLVGVQHTMANDNFVIHGDAKVGGSYDTYYLGRRRYALEQANLDFTIKRNAALIPWLPFSISAIGGFEAQQGGNTTTAAIWGVKFGFKHITIENDVMHLLSGKGQSEGFTPDAMRVDPESLHVFKATYNFGNKEKKSVHMPN